MLRQLAKRVLNAAGYSLRRKSTPIRTMGEFCTVLKRLGFYPGTVFDVGVAHGTPELYTAFPDALLVLVEPLDEFASHMSGILRQRSGFRYLAAAGETRGEVVLNVYPDLRKTSRYEKLGINASTQSVRKVPIIPLDDILAEHELQPSYLLKIDVEGDELSVLKGARLVLEHSEVVVLEVSVSKRFDRGADFSDAISFLTKCGFRLCDIVGAADTPQGLLMQIDLAFLRANGALSKKLSYA